MHRIKRFLKTVEKVATAPYKSRTGAVTLLEEEGTRLSFPCAVHPFDRRIFRDSAARRHVERRVFIPDGPVTAGRGDHLRVEGEAGVWRVSECRVYPGHVEIEAEKMAAEA